MKQAVLLLVVSIYSCSSAPVTKFNYNSSLPTRATTSFSSAVGDDTLPAKKILETINIDQIYKLTNNMIGKITIRQYNLQNNTTIDSVRFQKIYDSLTNLDFDQLTEQSRINQ